MRPIFGHFCRLFGYLLFVESKEKKSCKKAHKTDVTTKEKEQQ